MAEGRRVAGWDHVMCVSEAGAGLLPAMTWLLAWRRLGSGRRLRSVEAHAGGVLERLSRLPFFAQSTGKH